MNPLEPNDPLWNLLGKTRDVEVRGNFVQNVVRAARQERQEHGFWPRLKAWFSEGSQSVWLRPVAVAAAVTMAGLVAWKGAFSPHSEALSPSVVTAPAVPALESEAASDEAAMIQLAEAMPTMSLETVNEMNALLALEDASAMTDNELAFLLY